MARQYAPRAVLRHLPLELIRTFLTQEHILTGETQRFSPNWDALTEGDTNALYVAWRDLPQGPRERWS